MYLPRWIMMGCLRLALCCLCLASVGCPSNSGLGSATEGTGTSGGETSSTTFVYVPDNVACVVPECVDAADCCPDGGLHPGGVCPGTFPNNWECVAEQCVHGGCLEDDDCIVEGLECRTVNGLGRCVAPCANTAECIEDDHMDGTKCIGVGETTGFCLEDLSP